MKILFYYRDAENIGIEYLSSVLKKAGHKTELIFKTGSGSKFGMVNFKNFKKLDENKPLLKKSKLFKPDLLAFSCETDLFQDTLKMARFLKSELDIPTIIGGKHATNLPEYVINHKEFDMLCRGEGEEAFVELVNKLEKGKNISKIKNIWLKNKGKIIKNDIRPLIQDIDKIPFPDRDLFYKYNAFKHQLMVIASRGCPHSCSYCNNHFYRELYKGKGKYVRRRSVNNVIQEIKEQSGKYNIKEVQFEDENFLTDLNWLKEFCQKYKTEINLPFWVQAHPNNINKEKIDLLKKNGCKQIFMGVESGDEELRKNILHRYTTNKQIISSAKLIKDANITLQSTAIFGFPDENRESMWKTINLINKIQPDAIPTYTLYPYYNTFIFNYAKKKKYLSESSIELIKQGKMGSHELTILDIPYKYLSYNISKILSFYIKSPKILKPLIKNLFITNKKNKLVDLIYILRLPFDYPFVGRDKIKIFLNNLVKKYLF